MEIDLGVEGGKKKQTNINHFFKKVFNRMHPILLAFLGVCKI